MSSEELAELEKMAGEFRYWKRSDVVRAAVQFMAKFATPNMLYQIMAGYGRQWKDYQFTITNEQL